MKKRSFLLISIVFLSLSNISMSEVTEYLQCSFKENSIEKNFYWSIGADKTIRRWVTGEPISAMEKILLGMKLGIPWGSSCLIKKQCDKAAPCFRVRMK